MKNILGFGRKDKVSMTQRLDGIVRLIKGTQTMKGSTTKLFLSIPETKGNKMKIKVKSSEVRWDEI